MTPKLRTLILEAQMLDPQEQLELIGAVSQLLRQRYPHHGVSSEFWKVHTLADILAAQPIQPVLDVSELGLPSWPEDETADDVIAYLRKQRQQDRSREA
ncbi:MAG: hypothetical protein KatS3mg057_3185 [Herpetosiphonaceae bacterium]|nr:MAG: hypothetical protein KatS3mg057_3185 [Herpetosiphonaceae bacterium]